MFALTSLHLFKSTFENLAKYVRQSSLHNAPLLCKLTAMWRLQRQTRRFQQYLLRVDFVRFEEVHRCRLDQRCSFHLDRTHNIDSRWFHSSVLNNFLYHWTPNIFHCNLIAASLQLALHAVWGLVFFLFKWKRVNNK